MHPISKSSYHAATPSRGRVTASIASRQWNHFSIVFSGLRERVLRVAPSSITSHSPTSIILRADNRRDEVINPLDIRPSRSQRLVRALK